MSTIASPAPAAPRTERTSTAIFMLGTPHAAWEPLARAVLASDDGNRHLLDHGLSAWLDRILGSDPTQWGLLAADEERWKKAFGDAPRGGVDARLCWALEALNKRFPHSKYMVFVDAPVRALAHWIAASGPGGVEQAIDLWCAGAQRLLRHAHRYPQRVLMVASDEVAATPQALSGTLQERFGIALGKVPVAPGDDPMAVSLAAALVAGRPAVLGVYEELLATCLPLAEGDALVKRSAVAWRDDVVRLYREGRQAQAEVRQEFERERANAHALLLQLHAAEETIESQTVAERERLAQLTRVQGRESHLRNELALVVKGREQQVGELRNELALAVKGREQQVGKLRNELALAVKGREQQVGELRKKLRLQDDELAQATAKLAEQTKQARRHEETLQREIAAKTQAERELVAARQRLTRAEEQARAHAAEDAVLQRQVVQLQEQLRSDHAELEKIRRGGGVSSFSYHSVVFGTVNDKPPHRHVDAQARRLQWPGRTQAQMAVRLVEHDGRPGLALFEEEGHKPISGWQTSGQERGRDFMLLIPQDAAGARALGLLGSADWIAVTGIVQMLEIELGKKPFAAALQWRSVATRLRLLLGDLPPRLRYDTAAMCPAPKLEGLLAIDVRIDGALFGSQGLGGVRLRWLLGGTPAAQPPLRWLPAASGERGPALAHWPIEKNGQASGELIVPAGPGLDAASKRAAWAAFSAREQGILLGLLDALPACAAAVGAELLPPGWDAKRLAAAAQELRDDGHRSARSVRMGQLVRRVLRRAT